MMIIVAAVMRIQSNLVNVICTVLDRFGDVDLSQVEAFVI